MTTSGIIPQSGYAKRGRESRNGGSGVEWRFGLGLGGPLRTVILRS